MMILLTGCANITRGIDSLFGTVEYRPVVVDTGCKWTSIILISKEDVLTAGTARQILNHNMTYEQNCKEAEGE